MSIEPPKTGQGIGGPIIVLGFISVLLLAAMAIFGMLAFNITLPGQGGPADPADALTATDFTVVKAASGANSATVIVDVLVHNTGTTTVEGTQVLVQCEDNGYVSALRDVPTLEGDGEAKVQMQLNGTGSPQCTDPAISFSSLREPQ